MDVREFPVVEIFGPTIQGEGQLAGVRSHFVRLGYCDSRCVWCDSKHAVRPDLVRRVSTKMSASQILARVQELEPAVWITLTGGNPALHALQSLVTRLRSHHYKIAVETQGTIWTSWLQYCDLVILSPKGLSAGEVTDTVRLSDIIHRLRPQQTILKIVIFNRSDLTYARDLHRVHPSVPLYLQVGTPLVYDTDDETAHERRASLCESYRELCEVVLKHADLADACVLPQLHVLMWDRRQGV